MQSINQKKIVLTEDDSQFIARLTGNCREEQVVDQFEEGHQVVPNEEKYLLKILREGILALSTQFPVQRGYWERDLIPQDRVGELREAYKAFFGGLGPQGWAEVCGVNLERLKRIQSLGDDRLPGLQALLERADYFGEKDPPEVDGPPEWWRGYQNRVDHKEMEPPYKKEDSRDIDDGVPSDEEPRRGLVVPYKRDEQGNPVMNGKFHVMDMWITWKDQPSLKGANLDMLISSLPFGAKRALIVRMKLAYLKRMGEAHPSIKTAKLGRKSVYYWTKKVQWEGEDFPFTVCSPLCWGDLSDNVKERISEARRSWKEFSSVMQDKTLGF